MPLPSDREFSRNRIHISHTHKSTTVITNTVSRTAMSQIPLTRYPELQQELATFHTAAGKWFIFLSVAVFPIEKFRVWGGKTEPQDIEEYKDYWPKAKLKYPGFKIDRAVDHFCGAKIDLGGDGSLESRGMSNVGWAFKESMGYGSTLLNWSWEMDKRNLPRLEYRMSHRWATWRIVALFDHAGNPVEGGVELYHERGELPPTEGNKGRPDANDALSVSTGSEMAQPSQTVPEDVHEPSSSTISSLAPSGITEMSGATLVPAETVPVDTESISSISAPELGPSSSAQSAASGTSSPAKLRVFSKLQRRLSSGSLFKKGNH